MNTSLLISSSLRAMTRHGLRTCFMGLGVLLGVGTLITARSLGAGAEQAMMDKVNKMFGPTSLLVNARSAQGGGGLATTLTFEDLEAIERRLEGIEAIDPMFVAGGRQLKYLDHHRRVTIYGHSHHAERVWQRGVVAGRPFSEEDFTSASRVALLGTRLAEDLFGEADPVGEQILIDSVPFRVEGVLEPIGIDPHGMDRDEDVHVPTTTLMRRLLEVEHLTLAKLTVRDPDQVEQTAEGVERLLRERHGLGPGEANDFGVFTSAFVSRMVKRADRVLKVFVPTAAGVVLLVAALVISSLMLIAVRQRSAEIGLRRAVGATEAQIAWQFLLESLALCLASGLLGMLLAMAALSVVATRLRLPASLTADSVALGLGAAILVGLLSGFWPARRAARLDPARALQ